MKLPAFFDCWLNRPQLTVPPSHSTPWWLATYDAAPTDTCFGPVDRGELGDLLQALKVDAARAAGYTCLHGYGLSRRWGRSIAIRHVRRANRPQCQNFVAHGVLR